MQVVFIQSSEECCVSHSQCCHWSPQHSTLLQVGVMHCVDLLATAVTQKNDNIQTNLCSTSYVPALQVMVIWGGAQWMSSSVHNTGNGNQQGWLIYISQSIIVSDTNGISCCYSNVYSVEEE